MDPKNSSEPIAVPPPTITPPAPVVQGPEYQVDSTNEIEETKKTSKKVVLIVSLLLAVLIPVAIFAYSKHKQSSTYTAVIAPTPIAKPTSTPDSVAKWPTYMSNDLQIVFSYPPKWVINDYIKPYGWIIVSPEKVEVPNATDGFVPRPISVGTNRCTNSETNVDYPCEKTIDERIETWRNVLTPESFKLTDTHINSVEGKMVEGIGGPGPAEGDYIKEAIFTNGEYLLLINLYDKDQEDNFEKLMQSIVWFSPVPLPPSSTESGNQIFCTQEAKLCPDGSYVGRQGPNCEFEACPIPN